MSSMSPDTSLRSSASGLSSCSDTSSDVNSDGRVYLEDGNTRSSQKDSLLGSKHLLVSSSLIDNIDDNQRPYMPSDVNGISIVHDTWTTRKDEGVEPLYDQEMRSHSIEIAGSSTLEDGTSPFESELSAEFWIPPQPEEFFVDTNSSFVNDDDEDDEFGDGTSWGKPSSLSSFEEERSGSHKFKEEKQRALEEVKHGKFKVLVDQLLKSVGVVSSSDDGENWVDIVTSLSWDAAKFVKPDTVGGKAMDPDGCVKIKCIANGSPSHSKFIKGLVFKKHAAHKHMPTKYQKPRLLLIQGALGLSSNGLSSFESMQQEKDSLKSIIDVIEMYQPNIVLVEKTVSRDIQESILEKGMTLVLDMKLHRLERIACCTGSPILSSDVLIGQKLRQCNSFHFEKFVEEHTACGENAKKPSKTLMFLDGCPTRLGCTILLVGADSDQLKRIKCVVRCAVVMAYHLVLETFFLFDLKVMFSSIAITEGQKQAPFNQELSNVGASDPTYCHGESLTESVVSKTLDSAVSNGFHKEGSEYIISKQEANLSFSFESANPSIFPGLSPLSASFEKTMVDNGSLFSTSHHVMPTYFASDERKSNDRRQGDCQVLISTKAVDHHGTERRGTVVEDKAQDISEDHDYCLPVKDDITAVLDSESILVLMSSQNVKRGTMCELSHFSHIKFYRNFDATLGKFLHENLLNQRLHCKTCNELPDAHFYYYVHQNMQLKIQVRRLPSDKILPGESDKKLWMWSRCGKCTSEKGRSKPTKRVLISTDACGLSFGKFLELSFANPSLGRKSSCGHSLHWDYLYFFGLGPLVAMFKCSKLATYSVSLPPQKLEFGNLIRGEHLKKEFESVYTEGILMFLEIEKSLKEIRSQYLGMHLNLQGSVKEFSDIENMLMVERSQFEVDIQTAVKSGNGNEGMYKLLRLNKIRLELLLESFIWDRRLHYLLSTDLSVVGTKAINIGVTSQTLVGSTQEKDDGLDVAVENDENALYDPRLKVKMVSSEEESNIEREIPIDGENERSREQDETSYPVLVAEDLNMAVGGLQANHPSYVVLQTDKMVPISTDIDSSLLDSNSSLSGRSHFRLSFNKENDKGWIWNSFLEIRQMYMNDLQRGYLPKFETATSLGVDTIVYKLISNEGSRLHIPLGKDDYIVSDYEDEFSSIISCSLALLKDLSVISQDHDEGGSKEKGILTSNDNGQNLPRMFSLASPHWPLGGYSDSDRIHSSPSMPSEELHLSTSDSFDLLDSVVSLGAVHPEVSMGIGKVPGKRKYSVICPYSSQFRQLRNRCCLSEVDYIASLSRCRNWDAKGGKSKSFFAKTLDDRFIIKEIKRTEFEAFMKFASNYFDYLNQCFELGNQTCLAKILGIYQVTIRQAKNGKEIRHDLMVMENLSFGRNIDRQYDLKGALHSRFNSTSNGAGDVLLDQNFVNDTNISPLYVNKKSKQNLQRAVWNDTNFLKSIYVMDYSLLVGVDAKRWQLSCGIIDYLRQYTWDKQLETWVKSSLVVPKNLLPTVISPIEYGRRFRKFIGTHFLAVPDHWCYQRSSYPCLLCGMGDDGDDEDGEDCLQSKSQKLGDNGMDSGYAKPEELGEHGESSGWKQNGF